MEPTGENLDEQIRRNRSTRGSFDDFASHREHVMRLLLEAAADCSSCGEPAGESTPNSPDAPTLLLLGAGNCNDVDLPALLGVFGRVELVDWDAEALAAGCQSQQVADHPRLALTGGIDLAADTLPALPQAHVVASLCLLSQLIDSVLHDKSLQENALNQAADSLLDARIDAVRRRHLNLLVDQTLPGGISLLVTDFTSSLTAPALATATDAELPTLLGQLFRQGNFFRGLHPGVLFRILTTDPGFTNRVNCQNPANPWNWKIGNRVYAVSAIRMRRAPLQSA